MQWFWALPWEPATVLRVLIGFGLCQGVLIKLVATEGRRTQRFFLQLLFTFAFACASAAVDWSLMRFDSKFAIFVCVGIVGTFGTFFLWKAMAISQTRNALFTFWDDIIAMSIACVVLGEANFVTPPVALGIGVSFFALFLFIRHAWLKRKREETVVPLRLYAYIATYSVAWGIAYFAERYWSYRAWPMSEFLLAWYTGGLITGALMFAFYRDKAEDQLRAPQLTLRGVGMVFVLAVGIFVSMALTLPAYKASQVIVQPIFFVSEMALPVLFGLLFFSQERRQFDRIEWLYFIIGAIGALMVGLNFR